MVCIFPKWKFQTENSKIKIPKWKFQNVSVKDQHCRIIYLEGCIWNISGLVISSHADLLSISDHVKQAQVLSSSIPDSSSRWNHVDKLRNFTWDEISQGISSKDSKLSIYNFRTSSKIFIFFGSCEFNWWNVYSSSTCDFAKICIKW